MTGRGGPAGRVLGDLVLADHHCASLLATWARAGGGQWPAWRASFTGASRPASLARDVPGLLGYRHFLTALAGLLDVRRADPPDPLAGEELERQVVARRDELAAADPAATYGCCSTTPARRRCWSTPGPAATRS